MHIYFLHETYFSWGYEENDIICSVNPPMRSNSLNRYLTGIDCDCRIEEDNDYRRGSF